ncbi:MAG: phosphoribosylformylglycinamidine synthase subunit PurL, partial [Candidatus Thermoplasmatota archaeon]
RVREYFINKKRNPTDAELQSLGQAWSEHCCYKSSKAILKKFIFPITNNEVLAREDAGVMAFDEEHFYALRIESHNHPSAIEPYGGAATGIGGIIRDVLCMGAQPVALIDPLFFGPLDLEFNKLPAGIKHPKYLFAYVVGGIKDYGNRIGIPTCAGSVYFHHSYIGNCVVNVGCVGIGKKKNLIHSSVGAVGDLLVLVGGRTGRDGIHGVTFASAVLTEKAELESRGAVQLGNPIIKEPLIHACLECAEQGLLTGMKDLGGGGLSCVVGELAYAKGLGAEIELDKVPLKEKGLAPWEIWVSESQERMMLCIDKKNLVRVKKIFESWDLDCTPVGRVVEEKVVRIFYKGIKVFELDNEFLVNAPVYERARKEFRKKLREKTLKHPKDYNKLLLRLLSHPNIASKDWVIRQYDYEVRGCTVVKPLQGAVDFQTHGDATVLKPLENSYRGLAIATATAPSFSAINPYRGGKSVIDEVCRNLVAVGARPHSITNCLNFGNPEKPEIMYQFYEVVRGMGKVCKELNLPVPSGNVSFYNETAKGAILPTATVLGVGIVEDIRKCVTSELKQEGNTLYLIGETKEELGGSCYYELTKSYSSKVPDVNCRVLKESMHALLSAIEKGYVVACHDLSHGGLGIALVEMCIGSELGANIDITQIANLRADFKLFSESSTRWTAEVSKEKEKEFESGMKGIEFYKIGAVSGEELIISDGGKELINLPVSKLRDTWQKPLWELMG